MTFAPNTTLTAKNLGRRTGKVEFIVLHDTAGSGTENDAKYLANDPERRGISVDFCIDKSGTIWQLNPDLDHRCTFHAGRHTHYSKNGVVYENGGVNQHSVGIEIAQKADLSKAGIPLYPDAQLRAVAETCKFLCDKFGLTAKDITTHKAIITDGSRTDPRSFNWAAFWAFFGSNPPADNIPQPSVTGALTIQVKPGDTLWSLSQRYGTPIEQLKGWNNMNAPESVLLAGQLLRVK